MEITALHSHRYKPVRREHRATLAGTRICTEEDRTCRRYSIGLRSQNPGTRHLSIQTWVATNLKGQKEAAQEIIRANVSFCFTAHLLFTCNLQIQRSHMAVMRVYKGEMCRRGGGTELFFENKLHLIIARATFGVQILFFYGYVWKHTLINMKIK